MIGLAFTFTAAFNAVAKNISLRDGRHQGSRDSRAEAWLNQMEGNIRNTKRAIKEATRRFIEQSAQVATNGKAVVTSRDRPTGPLSSRAHDRGAIDIIIPGTHDLHGEARNISKILGPGYTTIVEEPRSDSDRDTLYKLVSSHDEVQVVTYKVQKRATRAHIHIQPDF